MQQVVQRNLRECGIREPLQALDLYGQAFDFDSRLLFPEQQLLALVRCPLAFGQITGNLGKAAQLPVRTMQRRNHHVCPEL